MASGDSLGHMNVEGWPGAVPFGSAGVPRFLLVPPGRQVSCETR